MKSLPESLEFVAGMFSNRDQAASINDNEIRLLAFIYGHDAAWIARRVNGRITRKV